MLFRSPTYQNFLDVGAYLRITPDGHPADPTEPTMQAGAELVIGKRSATVLRCSRDEAVFRLDGQTFRMTPARPSELVGRPMYEAGKGIHEWIVREVLTADTEHKGSTPVGPNER